MKKLLFENRHSYLPNKIQRANLEWINLWLLALIFLEMDNIKKGLYYRIAYSNNYTNFRSVEYLYRYLMEPYLKQCLAKIELLIDDSV